MPLVCMPRDLMSQKQFLCGFDQVYGAVEGLVAVFRVENTGQHIACQQLAARRVMRKNI